MKLGAFYYLVTELNFLRTLIGFAFIGKLISSSCVKSRLSCEFLTFLVASCNESLDVNLSKLMDILLVSFFFMNFSKAIEKLVS